MSVLFHTYFVVTAFNSGRIKWLNVPPSIFVIFSLIGVYVQYVAVGGPYTSLEYFGKYAMS